MYLSLYLSLSLSFIFHEHKIVFACCCFPGRRFPKQRLLDQLSLPWKNVTNISRTMRQWGGRRVNGGDGARARQEFASGPILPPPHLPTLEILPLLVEIVHPHYHDWAHSESSSGAPSDWPKPPFQSNQLLSISTSMPWEINVLTKCAPPEL